MKVDRHNIEAVLLDYTEGRLDPVETAELMAFLAENPEYENLLPDAGPAPILRGDSHFPGRSLLKKDFADVPEINHANFDEFCIAATEGLLTPKDGSRLEAWLQAHPEKVDDYRLYEKARLQADPSVVFPRKAALKKGAGPVLPIRLTWALLAAAAAVALFLLLYHPAETTKAPVSVASVSTPAPADPEPPVEPPLVRNPEAVQPVERIHPEPGVIPVSENTAPVSAEPLALQSIREARLESGIAVPSMVALLHDDGRRAAVPAEPLLARAEEERESVLPPMITSLFRKFDLWKAAESAVTGFNYLTESQIAISRTTDINGKPVGLALETDQFTIHGNKVK